MGEIKTQVTKEMKPDRAMGVQKVEWQKVGDSLDSPLVCAGVSGTRGEGR